MQFTTPYLYDRALFSPDWFIFTMSVRVVYDPDCDRNFPLRHHDQLQQWMNQNHRFANEDGTVLDFDEAYVPWVISCPGNRLIILPLLNLIATAFTKQVPTIRTQIHMSRFACRLHLCAAKRHGTPFTGESTVTQSFFHGRILRSHTREGRQREEKSTNRKKENENFSAGSHATGASVSSRGPAPSWEAREGGSCCWKCLLLLYVYE